MEIQSLRKGSYHPINKWADYHPAGPCVSHQGLVFLAISDRVIISELDHCLLDYRFSLGTDQSKQSCRIIMNTFFYGLVIRWEIWYRIDLRNADIHCTTLWILLPVWDISILLPGPSAFPLEAVIQCGIAHLTFSRYLKRNVCEFFTVGLFFNFQYFYKFSWLMKHIFLLSLVTWFCKVGS